jgi:hypothetical protein
MSSYLALDVYFAKSGGTKAFKKRGGLADLHSTLRAILLDGALCAVGLDEFTASFIVFEAKFVSEETKCYISISALGQRNSAM